MSKAPPGLLAPLAMPSAGERIAERLVAAIALGHFVPGQRLPSERELAEMLQVSRGPVREALQRLQASGQVVVKRGREGGAFVTGSWSAESDAMVRRALLPEWDRIDQLLDVRRMLEREIASAAAQRHNDTDLRRLENCLLAYDRAADRSASRDADVALHEAVATATHNPLLVRMSAQLRRDVNLGFDAEPYTEELRDRALNQHPALVEAIVRRDGAAAAELAGEHFDLTDVSMRHTFKRALDRASQLGPAQAPYPPTPTQEEPDHGDG